MTKKILINIFLLFLVINSTKAEVYKFFEFSPDFGERISINPNNQYIQRFVPFNDFLSLISIKIENLNSSTRFTFQLLDRNNILLVNKEIYVPKTNFNWSGTNLEIPLDYNLRINSGQEYKFKIISQEQSSLKIFAVNLLELLQNIESVFNLPETIRPLIINNEEQQFSFKIVLYEGQEDLPPIISNLNYRIINENLSEISFNANEPVRYDVFYKDNLSNSTNTYQVNYFESCPENIRDCSFQITIQPGREYYVKLIAFDYWNNSSTVELSFNTYINQSTSSEQNQEYNREQSNSYQTSTTNYPTSTIETTKSKEQKKISQIKPEIKNKTQIKTQKEVKLSLPKSNKENNLNQKQTEINQQKNNFDKYLTSSKEMNNISKIEQNQNKEIQLSLQNREKENKSKFNFTIFVILIIFIIMIISLLIIKNKK